MGEAKVDEVKKRCAGGPDLPGFLVKKQILHILPGQNGKLTLEENMVRRFYGTQANVAIAHGVTKYSCFVICVKSKVDDAP